MLFTFIQHVVILFTWNHHVYSLCQRKFIFNSEFFVPPFGWGGQNNHIKMTQGRGRWPRDLRELEWFSCAILSEKSVNFLLLVMDGCQIQSTFPSSIHRSEWLLGVSQQPYVRISFQRPALPLSSFSFDPFYEIIWPCTCTLSIKSVPIRKSKGLQTCNSGLRELCHTF